jgi:hypothetical protein
LAVLRKIENLLVQNKSTTKKVLNFIGVLCAVLAGIYFIAFFSRHVSSLPELTWDLPGVLSAAAALVFYGVSLLTMALVWHVLLRGTGEKSLYRETTTILSLAQFGKYIPGKVAPHIGRLALSKAYGYVGSRVIVSMILEIGWSILSGTFLTFALLLTNDLPAVDIGFSGLSFESLLLIILFASVIIPLGIGWIMARWSPTLLQRFLGNGDVRIPGFPYLFIAFLLVLVNFLISGGIADFLLRGLFDSPDSNIWILSGLYSIAWVIGFITPGAPAGLGVRETIFLTALRPIYGEGAALGLTIAMRVLTAAGDALIFAVGLVLRRRIKPKPIN